MSFVIEIFLPLGESGRFHTVVNTLRSELRERFGGVTLFARAPAHGEWKDADRQEQDDIVIVEVMAADLDRAFWSNLRKRLEAQLAQKEILIRAAVCVQL